MIEMEDAGRINLFELIVDPESFDNRRLIDSNDGLFLPFNIIIKILKDISCALSYCHSNDINHMDVKPENIMIRGTNQFDMTAKLVDFGLCQKISELEQETFWENYGIDKRVGGSLGYCAPEFYQRFEGKNQQIFFSNADMWGLGIVLYAMCTQCTPFDQNRYDMTMRKCSPQTIEQRAKMSLSNTNLESSVVFANTNILSMGNRMLTYDPRKRISSNELYSILKSNQF